MVGWYGGHFEVCFTYQRNKVDISVESFAYVMGIEDEWLSIELNGDMADLAKYLDNYDGTLQCINIKTLS